MGHQPFFIEGHDPNHPVYKYYTRKNSVNYYAQKSMSLKRGISWQLSLYEWLEWWVNTGHFHERGVCNHQYQMCRYNDKGAYSLDNIYCTTGSENKLSIYKKVIATNIETGIETQYNTRKELVDAGFNSTTVKQCCLGNKSVFKKHKFRFA
jgi:hypothetical protein